MAKQKTGNVIALEIEKYEKKINEFQTYLETNNINHFINEDRYKEYDMQIKMMSALPSWLSSLKSLKEEAESKAVELRGGNEVSEITRLRGGIQ